MAVYIDVMRASYRNMKMSHMVADSEKELLEMASKIGVNHKWIQRKSIRVHFDICESKALLAINKHNAKRVSMREMGKLISKNKPKKIT